MKIVGALDFGREMLAESTSATLDARWLLAHVLRVDLSYPLAHDDEVMTNEHLDAYFKLVARAERNEPLPYILGTAAFRYLDLHVTPAVLIPRPETEQLVDAVLKWAASREPLVLVDVGCGSGCIAISLATELAGVTVLATDISPDALNMARQNAETNRAAVTFYEGSLLGPITQPVDVIVANLPYITDAEMDDLPPSVANFEPALALRGGVDGLDLIRTLLQQATALLRPNGAIFLEIGYRQGAATTQLAQTIFPKATVICQKDYAGHDRFIMIFQGGK